jgi:two-component system response regulator AtoC
LPPNLLESELFGFEKGSFTGANQQHIGKFEQASGGTLLLDEITEMDINLQAKLLRALQEREIQRIGGREVISINTRIIATTNANLSQAVANGKFRQDLYYRLHVIPLQIPPLRERPKDIALLSNHFLNKFAKDYRKGELQFTDNAVRKIMSYSWPGNIRELQNIVQRSVLMTTNDFVDDKDIPIDVNSTVKNRDWISALPIGTLLHDLETHFILETLKSHNGNRTHAAKTLGISLRTLRNKINEYTAAGYSVQAPTSGKCA